MGSISSMEVNVDVLEQMDLMDISDQEALDVFLNSGSGADEGALASPLPGALKASGILIDNCTFLKPIRISIFTCRLVLKQAGVSGTTQNVKIVSC